MRGADGGVGRRLLLLLQGFVLLACDVSSCGEDEPEPEPCACWIEMGETYTVEVVAHVDPALLDWYPLTGHVDRTCGAGFDISVGDDLEWKAVEPHSETPEGNIMCSAGCYAVRAGVRIPGVEFASSGEGVPHTTYADMFFEDRDATVRGKCKGGYRISLMGYGTGDPPFFILHRDFHTDEPENCVVPGSHLLDSDLYGICSDLWDVWVSDSSGELVARGRLHADRPLSPLDAAMDGSDGEDGGGAGSGGGSGGEEDGGG